MIKKIRNDLQIIDIIKSLNVPISILISIKAGFSPLSVNIYSIGFSQNLK
jgi:hypothetical protein